MQFEFGEQAAAAGELRVRDCEQRISSSPRNVGRMQCLEICNRTAGPNACFRMKNCETTQSELQRPDSTGAAETIPV